MLEKTFECSWHHERESLSSFELGLTFMSLHGLSNKRFGNFFVSFLSCSTICASNEIPYSHTTNGTMNIFSNLFFRFSFALPTLGHIKNSRERHKSWWLFVSSSPSLPRIPLPTAATTAATTKHPAHENIQQTLNSDYIM